MEGLVDSLQQLKIRAHLPIAAVAFGVEDGFITEAAVSSPLMQLSLKFDVNNNWKVAKKSVVEAILNSKCHFVFTCGTVDTEILKGILSELQFICYVRDINDLSCDLYLKDGKIKYFHTLHKANYVLKWIEKRL